uniref:HAT C-terminal dimerisation domain-containing protein n=1 Tax=Amphimedon queenslandica TaxID=400682 RepID=A0A1X7U699_AMPQE
MNKIINALSPIEELASIAQKYLCAPRTFDSSERLFLGAGLIYDESRNRLSPDNAEILLFVTKNFDYLN